MFTDLVCGEEKKHTIKMLRMSNIYISMCSQSVSTHLTKLTTEKIELSSVFLVSQYTPNQDNHLKQLKGSIAANI
jgi:hypothetical protein